MKLQLTINGREEQIEIVAPVPQCRFRWSGGPELQADVQTPEPGVFSILLEGRSYDAREEETHSALLVVIDGHRFEIAVHDPRRLSRVGGRPGAEGAQNVAAPMPGKVVRVLVAAGDAVRAGQGLIVVEAMKMQNEMKAARAGTVRAVSAREGATVAAGEVLATIE